MESRTRSTSPAVLVKQEEVNVPANKISAYYSLVFPHFTFYIQTLSITIGRRCNPNPNPNPNATASSSSAPENPQVDVDLGALKSVSRLHAKIEYDPEEDRFFLVVIGRNGAWVDGVWSGSGTRTPLGERSQIQIASRTFHFVLPPPPPPEDTPSPSSHSSTNRPRSPSVDITSISPPSSQPSHSPPPPPRETKPKPPTPPPEPQLPNSNAIGKPTKASTSKKRKKSEASEVSVPEPPPPPPRPRPEEMPPKPTFTYAQLIYRAIKAHDGKSTLQEICNWIMNEFEYYRYAEGAWMSSVRHNLSSGRAFKKMERCGGDRGKGFFWSLDENFLHIFEEQEAKARAQAAQNMDGEDKAGGKGKKKDKGASITEPPLKRSIKGDAKAVLPPPLTSAPHPSVAGKTTPAAAHVTATTSPPPATNTSGKSSVTGVFAYPHHPHMMTPATMTSSYSGTPMNGSNPYTVLTQSHWMNPKPAGGQTSTATQHTSTSTLATVPANSTPPQSAPTTTSSSPPTTAAKTISMPSTTTNTTTNTTTTTSTSPAPTQPPNSASTLPDVVIPIILGPIPPTHPEYSPSHPNNSAKVGYMILHERTLILDPDVFSELTREALADLEKMGARQALNVLTVHMVKALKERRKKKNAKNRGRGGKNPGGPGRKTVPGSSGSGASAGQTDKPAPSNTEPSSLDSTPMAVDIPSQSAATAPASLSQQRDQSPIIIVDSDDEGPAAKRRKLESLNQPLTITASLVPSAS
ncbi:Pre-rRNA-processing protein fhl1 [Stygiomarasmius scandens]|uniref:Pre-rRNA-processing protein fhl1 n=1 Tax=Marasmiellus scandens TaxID=2682957 RepID=A0ABR1K1R0_9AGAR